MEMISATTNFPRRSANYKPNIWNYDYLISLTDNKHEELDKLEREAETLTEQVCSLFVGSKDPLHKLELVDLFNKLGISHLFEEEIRKSLEEMHRAKGFMMEGDLYSAALYFRILRQHGYHVSQETISRLLDDKENWWDEKTRVEILEASHVVAYDEEMLDKKFSSVDVSSATCVKLNCPSHRSVSWFNVRSHMHANNNPIIERLAGLSFKATQLHHHKDLNHILRWWRKVEALEVVKFSRDRVVESFLTAVGVAYEPQHTNLRKWLTKAICMVVIMDDVYDIYGSIYELEQLTNAIERWDPSEIPKLPETIKSCFSLLYDTTNDIDLEIQKEKGWSSVLPHLRKVWTGFCKAVLVEAKWYEMGVTPSLQEYLENGLASSSGAVLCLHVLAGAGDDMAETVGLADHEIIHHTSLIFRLCNDLGTFKAEAERGDAPSSIVCHMKEANVTEKEAREHIRGLVSDLWKKINGAWMRCPKSQQKMTRYSVNIARMANFFYQNGDGFGVQDQETKNKVLSCLIHPSQLAPPSP